MIYPVFYFYQLWLQGDWEPDYYIETSPISFECWAYFIYALNSRPLGSAEAQLEFDYFQYSKGEPI